MSHRRSTPIRISRGRVFIARGRLATRCTALQRAGWTATILVPLSAGVVRRYRPRRGVRRADFDEDVLSAASRARLVVSLPPLLSSEQPPSYPKPLSPPLRCIRLPGGHPSR